MTRKDFVLIAEAIKATADANTANETAQWVWRRDMAVAFATRLAGTNARFDRDKFLRACGLTSLNGTRLV